MNLHWLAVPSNDSDFLKAKHIIETNFWETKISRQKILRKKPLVEKANFWDTKTLKKKPLVEEELGGAVSSFLPRAVRQVSVAPANKQH